jgi:hypothetical protein
MIPIDIQLKALLYPITDYKKKYDCSTTINVSKGEIDKPNMSRFPEDTFIGRTFLGSDYVDGVEVSDYIKVYLGKGYFKCISRVMTDRYLNSTEYQASIRESKIDQIFK